MAHHPRNKCTQRDTSEHGSGARVLTPRPTTTRVTGDYPRTGGRRPIRISLHAAGYGTRDHHDSWDVLSDTHHERNVNSDENAKRCHVDRIKIARGAKTPSDERKRRWFFQLPCA